MANAVASGATIALAAIERSRAMADAERQAAERASQERGGELKDRPGPDPRAGDRSRRHREHARTVPRSNEPPAG